MLAISCAHGDGAHPRPGSAELRALAYTDNTGLTVVTTAIRADQQVAKNVVVWGRTIGDYLNISRRPYDPGDPEAQKVITGHHDGPPDVTTSASALPSGGGIDQKYRFDGTVGTVVRGTVRGLPVSGGAELRGSVEPDYQSTSGVVRGSIDLFQQTTTIAGFVGYGHDKVIPARAPPGQEASWPATHDRFFGGVSVAQILSPRLMLSLGAAATGQRGMLASPYRRALVRTTLFPEEVPSTRDRYTGFVALAWAVGWKTALHARLGGYADSWGVLAFIPELAASRTIGKWGLLSARYRYYQQTQARFYKPQYDQIERLMSGDQRLGVIHAHTLGAELRATVLTRPGGALSIGGSYDLGLFEYDLLGITTVVAHMVSLGLSGAW